MNTRVPSTIDHAKIVSIVQHTEVTLVNGHYSKTVASIESKEGYPILPNSSLNKSYQLLPLASANKERRGIALDGMVKESDTNLASSTNLSASDATGIIISYAVRVRLYLGAIGGDLTADVPFKLVTLDPQERKEKPSEKYKEKEELHTMEARRLRKQLTREMSSDLIIEEFSRNQESDDKKQDS